MNRNYIASELVKAAKEVVSRRDVARGDALYDISSRATVRILHKSGLLDDFKEAFGESMKIERSTMLVDWELEDEANGEYPEAKVGIKTFTVFVVGFDGYKIQQALKKKKPNWIRDHHPNPKGMTVSVKTQKLKSDAAEDIQANIEFNREDWEGDLYSWENYFTGHLGYIEN